MRQKKSLHAKGISNAEKYHVKLVESTLLTIRFILKKAKEQNLKFTSTRKLAMYISSRAEELSLLDPKYNKISVASLYRNENYIASMDTYTSLNVESQDNSNAAKLIATKIELKEQKEKIRVLTLALKNKPTTEIPFQMQSTNKMEPPTQQVDYQEKLRCCHVSINNLIKDSDGVLAIENECIVNLTLNSNKRFVVSKKTLVTTGFLDWLKENPNEYTGH